MTDLDADLALMAPAELLAAARAMRAAIRTHRDASEHELCWHHPQMWALLPDASQVKPEVPGWPQFMRGCIHYRQSLDSQLAEARRTDTEFQG